ncbi:MAG TPA: glycosyltransferase [Ignavibacteria bacterium]|nr:glycosyltransferase [Ignavibacteria bacterium]
MSGSVTLHDLYWVLGEQTLSPLELFYANALKKNGKNVNYINIHSLYNEKYKKLSSYSHRLPRRYDNLIQKKYFELINDRLKDKFIQDKPSHIFIYNDCKLLSETLEYFQKCGTKIVVFLGDDPNYLFPAKKTFLFTVMNADHVIVPDSGWIDGLKMLGIKNIIFSPVGTDTEVFFPVTPDSEQNKNYGSDIIFAGTGYFLNSWGIKRASVLNELSGMNFKLFGDIQWLELFPYFPELKKHYINKTLPAADLNIACNCAKIYPVTVNAGVVNGVSTRIFDCISSGIFVLAEFKKDFEKFFPGGEVICFNSKNDLKDKVDYFLKNENEMKDHINKAADIVRKKYTLEILTKNILEQIKS